MGTTLAKLRGQAYQIADMAKNVTEESSPNDVVNQGFVPVAEMNKYINFGYKKLYGMLQVQHEFYFVSEHDVTMDGSEDYDLPSDFQSLLGVDLLPGGDETNRYTLFQFPWSERNRYRSVPFTYYGTRYLWHLVGNKVRIQPNDLSNSSDKLRIYYVPELTELSSDTDEAITEGIFDEYIATYAARIALDKEESDTRSVNYRLKELEQFVIQVGESRQVAQAYDIAEFDDSYNGMTGWYNYGRGTW